MAAAPPQDSPSQSPDPSPSDSSSSSPPPSSSPSPSPPPPPPPPNNSSPPPPSLPPPSDDSSPPSDDSSPPSPPPPSDDSSPPSDDSSPPSDNSSPPPPKKSSPSPPPPNNDNSSPKNSGSSSNPSPPYPSSTTPNGDITSPPPPKLAKAAPSPKSLSTTSSKTPSSDGGSSKISTETAIIVGVTVGVILLLGIMMIICCCMCNKKKKKRPEPMYYMENRKGGGEYYNNAPQQYWQKSGKANDYMGPPSGPQDPRLQPTPGAMGMDGSNWSSPQPFMTQGPDGNSSFARTPVPPIPAVSLGFNKNTFTYDELATATGGFSSANLLGQGGFGYVHKGVFPNGKEVAVKSLKSGSNQGEREFQAEVDIISRVHHRYLVSLVGYCISGSQRMLVYEFIPNNNLEYHLHGKDRPCMDWSSRLKIALGSAKGLAYLHEDCQPRIIHRDIKAANILLDYSFEAKVADFGLAKLNEDTHTHVSTRIMGTFGYLAPEYASSGKLSDKSDVFSFGVMLLELITGRPPIDLNGKYDDMDDSLVDWARPLTTQALDDGVFDHLVDPRLMKNYIHHEMACMVACAAACVRHSARRRPKMSQVVRAMEGEVSLEALNEGVRPGHSAIFSSSCDESSDYNARTYSADMKKFRKMALESQEYPSSEYGATSEYGLNPSSSSGESAEMQTRRKNDNLKNLSFDSKY